MLLLDVTRIHTHSFKHVRYVHYTRDLVCSRKPYLRRRSSDLYRKTPTATLITEHRANESVISPSS